MQSLVVIEEKKNPKRRSNSVHNPPLSNIRICKLIPYWKWLIGLRNDFLFKIVSQVLFNSNSFPGNVSNFFFFATMEGIPIHYFALQHKKCITLQECHNYRQNLPTNKQQSCRNLSLCRKHSLNVSHFLYGIFDIPAGGFTFL